MIAVWKHELSGYAHSLTSYIFAAAMLLFVGIGAMLYNISYAVANFEYVLQYVCIGLTVIVPVLTMRVLAEEKKQKTEQLLFSLPLTSSKIILGKYLALLVIFVVPLLVVAFYPLIFSKYGDIYLLTSYGSLFAFILMGAALLAVGMFCSSLTENQGFAAGIGIVVLLFYYFSVSLAENVSSTAFGSLAALSIILFILALLIEHLTKNFYFSYGIGFAGILALCIVYRIDSTKFEGLLPTLMKNLSIFEHFYTFVNGVFDLTGIIFFLSVIVFFLFLCVQSLEKRRYN